jgi:hypothetical protein
MRIKDEIEHLHAKKQHLNYETYKLHLTLANTWNNMWLYMLDTILANLQIEIHKKYQKLDTKLKKLAKDQTAIQQHNQSFYPRVINDTDIIFSKQEMAMLQKGLKYNLHSKPKNWLQNLALEEETAIQALPTPDREIYRHTVVNRISTLQKNSSTKSDPKIAQQEERLIKSIKSKINTHNATVTRADKGNSIVILPTDQYDQKLNDFIQNNNFMSTSTDPTKNFQAHGQIFHIQIKTIRPLPNKHNIENTKDLIHRLKHTPISPQ